MKPRFTARTAWQQILAWQERLRSAQAQKCKQREHAGHLQHHYFDLRIVLVTGNLRQKPYTVQHSEGSVTVHRHKVVCLSKHQ